MLKNKTASSFYESDVKTLIMKGLGDFEGLDGLVFAPDTLKAVIYPTDDVCLNKDQYNKLVSILKSEEELTVIQAGWTNDFFAEGNIAYTFCEPFSYEEYSELKFFSPSIIISSLLEWLIIIDESLYGGEALIVGKDDRVSQFLEKNGHGIQDILRFVDFYINDSYERSYKPIYLKKMIRLLMPSDDQRNDSK